MCWCVLPLATWTPSFVIFQSTSTPTAPQLTSVSSMLLLATARGGQCSSSLGGSVTVTSPRVETWKHANTKRNITCHYEKGVLIILCHTSQNYFLSFLSHLVVSSPGHQTDRITSRKSIFVSCCGYTCSCSVDSGWKVTKVPGQCHRSDRGGGIETDAVVNTLQWERLQWDREVHREHIVSQSPPTFLCAEGIGWGRGGLHKYLKVK